MDVVVRSVVLIGGLVAMIVLFYLNLYVSEKYWLPTVADEQDEDPAE